MLFNFNQISFCYHLIIYRTNKKDLIANKLVVETKTKARELINS
jgi:hypothetical protein